MALNHFSHDHPLMLVNQVQKEEGEKDVVCYGCQKPISSSAYSCNDCKYFLHRKCAELRKEITHDKHLQHPLTLLSYPFNGYSSCFCDVCGIEDWKWFTYSCTKCEFDVHIPCVLEDRVVHNESHPHPLTVVHKKAMFKCDACSTEDKDMSYFCNTCEFWIHKSCALSPSTIQHNSHDHPLVLNYFLPYIHRSFTFRCDICKEKVHPNYWVYDCDKCRYFVHVKCATSKTMIRGATSETTAEDDELEASVIKFPIVDESVNLLDELLKEANLGDTNRATMLTHFSHDHPLILFDNEDEMKNDEIIICKGCLLPIISTPFYGCDRCNFFLHGSCAEVPQELRHSCHQENHQFNLKMSFASHYRFACYSCLRFHNGFRYKCDSCGFTLCVVCALLPVKIRHEAHYHPLRIQRVEKDTVCDGCKFRIHGGLIYRCHTCDYYVDIHCLKLPHKVKHAWDRHLLTLRYPPYSDHPDEFYCEICEEQIHPKYWLYHCNHCDQPFHIECLFPIFKNIAKDVIISHHVGGGNYFYCVLGQIPNSGATSETTAKDELEPSVIKFPIVDESVNLLDELLKEANLGDTNRAAMLTHFSHDHPLILFDNEDEKNNDEMIICKGCLLPIISTPFYGCDRCNFFLHGSCAEIPQELRHPCHQENHQFNLKMSFASHYRFACYSCLRFHNGFRYKCDSCDFTLCVVCALLPVKIRHDAHYHPLRIQRVEKVTVCEGCKFRINGGLIYRCHTCDYYVDIHCLKLPHKVKRAWDRHLLTLRYPPYSDHPDEFYCEICEEEMHPKYWLYHCRHCDQPFHTKCLFPIFKYIAKDVNAGDTIEVGIHPHKLTPVFRRAGFKCKRCDRIIPNADMFLKCEPCRWQLCPDCSWSNSKFVRYSIKY